MLDGREDPGGGPPGQVEDALHSGGALGEADELTLGQRLEALQMQSRAVRLLPLCFGCSNKQPLRG